MKFNKLLFRCLLRTRPHLLSFFEALPAGLALRADADAVGQSLWRRHEAMAQASEAATRPRAAIAGSSGGARRCRQERGSCTNNILHEVVGM